MVKDQHFRIADHFLARVSEHPERPAVIFEDMIYTYAMVAELAATFAIKFCSHGVEKDSTLLLGTDDLPVVVATLISASVLGVSVATKPISSEAADHTLVTDASLDAENMIVADETWSPANFESDKKRMILAVENINLSTPWLLTSFGGSEDETAVVDLSQQAICHRSGVMQDGFEARENRLVSLFNYAGGNFIVSALAALQTGATIVDRGSWEFWSASNVDAIYGSLAQARRLDRDEKRSQKLPKLELFGTMILPADATVFLQNFDLVESSYISAEFGRIYSHSFTPGENGDLKCEILSHGCEIEIVSEDGKQVSAGEIGIVRVANKLRSSPIDFLADTQIDTLNDYVVLTNDLGRYDKHANLEFFGQSDDGPNGLGKINLNAELLDSVIASVDGIVEAAVFSSPKPKSADLLAFVVFENDVNRAQVGELVKMACGDSFGNDFLPEKIWPVDTIPRNSDRTPDRELCAEIIMNAAKIM